MVNKYDGRAKGRNWAKIRAEYCTTSLSLREIAKKYKIPYSTANSRSLREGWSKTKEMVKHDIDAEVADKLLQKQKEKVIDEKVKVNQIHNELYDKGLDIVRMLLDKYMRELQEGKKTTRATPANIDYLMNAIARAQKGQRLSLNITPDDGDEELPSITAINGLDISKI